MQKEIYIIGGGIIGLSSAWYLNEAGYAVTVIDRSQLEEGTSHGNAGMIVPSHFVPLASPGVITQGLQWLLDKKSPFYIKPRWSLDLARWLWQFYRSCTPEKVKKAMPILKAYNEYSKAAYQAFAQKPGFDFCYTEKGLLMLYQTLAAQEEEIEMAEKAHALGMEAQVLNSSQVQALEKGTRVDVLGAVYYPGDAHLYPNRFMQQLVRQLQDKGVVFIRGKSVSQLRCSAGKVESLELSDGQILACDQVLLTAGSWTAQLAKKAGVKLLLQDGKGYSTTLKQAPERPGIPSLLAEAKVAVTPMGQDLRIGGTLEISNLSSTISKARVQGIIESVSRYYPDISVNTPEMDKIWHGFRPCSPDGLPYLGYAPQLTNLFVATGHAMMGMSLGPGTGKIVADLIQGKQPELPVDLFRLDRF